MWSKDAPSPLSRPPPVPALHRRPTSRRARRESRLARVYDAEILPIWAERFGELLLKKVTLPERGTILDVLCCTGRTGLCCLDRGGDGLRVVAIDSSSAMLEGARRNAGTQAGRRIYFRSEHAEPFLPFAEGVYELVLSNLGLCEVADPRRLLGEMARVAKPGAQVGATVTLDGTFAEFHEILCRAIASHADDDHQGASRSATGHVDAARFAVVQEAAAARLWAALPTPTPQEAAAWAEAAGLVDVRVAIEHFTLLFAGGRDLLFAPVIEYGPLPLWREIAGGEGARMQAIFIQVKDEINRRASPERPFELTVRAGCITGRKPD